MNIDITFHGAPPPTLWRCTRFGFGLLWTAFASIAMDNLYILFTLIYKLVRGENAYSWSEFALIVLLSVLVLRTYRWFRQAEGPRGSFSGGAPDEKLTPRQRWKVCTRLKTVAYEHGVEAHELVTSVRLGRLFGKVPNSYAHFREWHRASLVCRLGLRFTLNDLVKRIGSEATEKEIRKRGSLLLALAKAAQ